MLLHYSCSLLVAWVNKLAFLEGFKWTTLLTVVSNLFIFFTFEFASRKGIIRGESLPFHKALPVSLAFCGFVVFNSLSLGSNDSGVYEMSKVLVTPAILIMQSLLYTIAIPSGQGIALFSMVIGMTLATVSSFNFNAFGTLWGLLTIICASLYQVLIYVTLRQSDCRPLQLLHSQSLISAILLFMIMPLVEDVSQLAYTPSFPAISLVAFSCVLSLVINATIYIIISEASPISYNVLCNGEVCLVLSAGYLFFGDPLTIKCLVGVLVADLSIVWFVYSKLRGIDVFPSVQLSRSQYSAIIAP